MPPTCASCKFLRRKCTQDCVFAPYFPPDQPNKFLNVHKVYGASNVAKLLKELNPSEREDAVNSLACEAEMRLIDPIYGCVGVVSALEQQLQSIQSNVTLARKQLSSYIGPAGVTSFLNQFSQAYLAAASSSSSVNQQSNMDLGPRQCLSSGPMMGSPTGVVASPGAVSPHVRIGQPLVIIGPQNQQQSIDAHRSAAKQEQDVMMRNWEHQQVIRLGGGSGSGSVSVSGSVCGGYEGRMIVDSSSDGGDGGGRGRGGGGGGEYSQVGSTLANAQPSLAVGAFAIDPMAYNNQIQQHEKHEQQHQHHQQHEQQHQHHQQHEQQHQHHQQHEHQLVESLEFLLRQQSATTQPHQGHVDQLGERIRLHEQNQQLLQQQQHHSTSNSNSNSNNNDHEEDGAVETC
ncbi:LOB domain-containing protein 6-like [Amaranthus tricolor]|uniref:LOB domain-containing protein 6-like n=1 Tax=Amaranthus tricolor TaxID=29722 RepID=UPI00258C9256|nr:LOB domain-containing protein 6-like [Amaranthus tricolor]